MVVNRLLFYSRLIFVASDTGVGCSDTEQAELGEHFPSKERHGGEIHRSEKNPQRRAVFRLRLDSSWE